MEHVTTLPCKTFVLNVAKLRGEKCHTKRLAIQNSCWKNRLV